MRIYDYPNQCYKLTKQKKMNFALYDYQPMHKRITKLIIQYMENNHLSLEQMAFYLDISKETLINRLYGGVDYRGLELLELTHLLEIDFNQLMYDEELETENEKPA